MKLLIADDHPIVLDGLEALLRDTEFTVAARCSNGKDVLSALETLEPDILVLDLHMQPVSGLEVLQRLNGGNGSLKVVILTASMDDECLVETVRLGAAGILLKKTASHRLLDCLETVRNGDRWLDPEVTQRLIQATMQSDSAEASEPPLTAREMEITRLVASGLRNKEIAHEMAITEPTVKMHLHNIYEKLGLGSRTELAIFAHSRGVL